MGSVACKSSNSSVSKRIDIELKKDEVEQNRKLKLLLLGSADAGKSTIVKQMRYGLHRILHQDGFNDTERINAIFEIRVNVIEAFKQICLIILNSDDIIIEPENENLVKLFAYNSTTIELMPETDEISLINNIRYCPCIKEFFRIHKAHPNVPHNIYYYFPELHRILLPNYIPTDQDIIHLRVTTSGVHEISFDYRKIVIRLIDVGGQRTERRKWIHFFEGVSAVIFVASLTCFDQFIEEETKMNEIPKDTTSNDSQSSVVISCETFPNVIGRKVSVKPPEEKNERTPKMINRLTDSIQLFSSVQKNNFLHKSTFILFLNKLDILKEKLKQINFVDYFNCQYELSGLENNDPMAVCECIESLFRKGFNESQKLYSHFTVATDSSNLEMVFDTACDVIFQKHINNVEVV